ncbi:MAG: hypothetical protein KJZ80_12425 [Hyphomicrobiaceae bacterium]|nr:hypothetical protein [Hyphomicrobiaceae bacterium]
MQLDWEKLFKRYVLDDERTPYFVAPSRMTRVQARHELFLYSLFTGILFAAVGIASLSSELPHKGALAVPLYALSMVWSAIALGITRSALAAAWCASAPVGVLVYFVLFGFHPNLGPWDKVLLFGFVVLWLRYGWRVLAIVRAHPDRPGEE